MTRNNTDLNRGEQLSERMDNIPNPGRDGANLDRSERSRYQAEQSSQSDGFLLSSVAKIAGIGVAGYLLGRVVPKDIWVDALHKMGQYGSATFGRALATRDRILSQAIDKRIVNAARRAERDVELARVVRDELNPFVADINQAALSQSATTYARNQVKAALQTNFSAAAPSGKRYTGLTLGDVLGLAKQDRKSAFKVIGEKNLDILERFHAVNAQKSPWIDNLVVDRHLYKSTAGRLNFSSIRDTRWASRRGLGDLATNGLGFQIPFIGLRPIDLISPLLKLGGRGPTFFRVGQNVKVAEGVYSPGYGLTYGINGKLHHFDQLGARPVAPEKRFRYQEIDGIAKASLARLGQHPAQNPQLSGSAFDTAQDLLGFGPAYRQQSFIGNHLLHGARVRKGLKTGTIKWQPNLEVTQDALPYKQRLSSQLAGTYNERALVLNPYKDYKDLPFIERIKARLGFSRYGKFIDSTRPVRPGTAAPSFDENLPFNLSHRDATPKDFGQIDRRIHHGKGVHHKLSLGGAVFEDSIGNKLGLVGDFMTNRLNQLFGATLGIGFKPGKGRFGAFWSATRIAAIGAFLDPMNGLVIEAYKYMDYLFKQATSLFGRVGPGLGPTDIAQGAFEYSTLGAAFVKDITGITSAAKYLEGLMPGIMESPLSGFARTIAPLSIGGRFGPKGLAIGALAAIGLGGPSDVSGVNIAGAGITTSFDSLRAQYSGDEKVRVRSSRWWEFGRQSFYGEGTDRFEPHWLALSKSDFEYSNSLYGSKHEYFSHASPLPTLHNLFGLRKDDNYFAEMHKLQRPYPLDASGNPHVGYNSSGLDFVSQSQMNIANSLGTDAPYNPDIEYGSRHDLSYKVKDAFNRITEFGGIYKFFGETIFGKLNHGPVLDDASRITSKNRLYWDKDLGSLLGFTELYRRYNLSPDDIKPDYVYNPIANQMPSFLPGANSPFKKDREYYIDFTKGDPFTKIKGGEYRLPGKGYEAVNELHSETPGVYTEVDAFMILADVAPYSEAYSYYESKISQMNLSPEWRQKVNRAIEERNIKTQGIAADFFKPKFSGSKAAVQGINEEIKYNAAERLVGRAYENLVGDVLPELGSVVPMGGIITHKLFPHHTAERDYLERVVYDHRLSDWAKPIESFAEPKLTVLYNENPLTASAGASALGLLSATNPAAGIVRGATFGAALAGASTYRAALHGSIEGGYIPSERRKEQETLEYFDRLEYLRMEKAKNLAYSQNNSLLANQFQRQQNRTMVGLNYSDPQSLYFGAMAAIPKDERPYFKSFFNETDPEARERILESSPQYMDDIYKSLWDPGSIKRDKNAAMRDFIRNNNIPDDNWAGWNPALTKQDVFMRTMDTVDESDAINLHKQKISMQMMTKARSHIPDTSLGFSPHYREEAFDWFGTASSKHDFYEQGYNRNSRINMTLGGQGDVAPYTTYRIKKDREEQYRRYIRERL